MIEYVRDGAVVRISLDDGGRNVLTPTSVASLRSIIADAEASNEVQAIILSGNNHALSVGLDTATVLSGDKTTERLLSDMSETLTALYMGRLRSIVVTQGHATAAGAMLLLVADVRIGVAPGGKIGLSEVSVGLAVPEATLQLLRDRLLPGQQFACAGLSKLYDYQQASEIGFLDHLVPCSSDAQALAAREAARLGALPEEAYLETKLSLRNRYAQLVNFSNH